MDAEDYRHLATTLTNAIEAAMWSADFTEQVDELSAVQDALERQGKDLPLPDAARVRLEVLQVLKRADEYADDPRAKEFGTQFCLLETMTPDERTRLAGMLIQLLRFVAAKSELDG
jgi:hypothetical protein